MSICPHCGEENVWERHTVYIEPKKRLWDETKKDIIEELEAQECNPSTYGIECMSCGAEWESIEQYEGEKCKT